MNIVIMPHIHITIGTAGVAYPTEKNYIDEGLKTTIDDILELTSHKNRDDLNWNTTGKQC